VGVTYCTSTKKNGELRMCIDFRKPNDHKTKNKYPIQRMDEIIDEMANSKIFSKLDATSGYHQIKIEKEDRDREKAVFRCEMDFTSIPECLLVFAMHQQLFNGGMDKNSKIYPGSL
jgi:hypothetical protein